MLDERARLLDVGIPIAAVQDRAVDVAGHFLQRRVDLGNFLLRGELFRVAARVNGAAIPHAYNLVSEFALDQNPGGGMRCIEVDQADLHGCLTVLPARTVKMNKGN